MHNLDLSTATAAEAVWGATYALLSDKSMRSTIPGVFAETLGARFDIAQGDRTILGSNDRRFNYRSQVAESLWNLVDTRDVTPLCRYISNMRDYCDHSNTAQWAYGPYINAQVMRAVYDLEANPNSRQAVIYTGIPDASGPHNSPPCLSSVQWLVRNGKVDMIVTMRSNDVYRGLPLDLVQFSLWQKMVAAFLGLPVGRYIHNAGSFHLYERDVELAEKFIQSKPAAFRLPEVGPDAILDALSFDFDGNPADYPCLLPYADLLAGIYVDPLWDALRKGGYGRGW